MYGTVQLGVFLLLLPASQAGIHHVHGFDIHQAMVGYETYKVMYQFLGGEFYTGINDPRSETGEYPPRKVKVKSFRLDKFPVTNAEFWEYRMRKHRFRGEAELKGWSWVFERFVSNTTKNSQAIVGSNNWMAVKGANWERPEGPDSDIRNRWTHPVVHVSWNDAKAYCQYYNKRLPTEYEWEFAARGDLVGVQYPWGERWQKKRANIWQGRFPKENSMIDGYVGTSPVDAYPPQNDRKMYDMLGNVWEWTFSRYYERMVPPELQPVMMVLKGGSFLDSRDGSFNFAARTSNRMGQPPDYTANNVGFRCATSTPHMDPKPEPTTPAPPPASTTPARPKVYRPKHMRQAKPKDEL